MVIFLLFGIVLSGVAVGLAARGLALGGARRQETFAQISAYGFAEPEVEHAEPMSPRDVANAAATAVGRFALRGLSDAFEREQRTVLRSAGFYRAEPALYLGYRILGALVIPGLLLLANAGSLGPRQLLIIVFAGAMGWVLPSFVVKRRGAKRLDQIDRETPELVDLLVTTVEAGIGFTGALQMVSRSIQGPLGQELRITLHEQRMGLTIEDALQNMLGRVDSLSIRTFVQAIVQGQTLGVSIGKILRDLAVDMRKRRRQLAEEQAQKAPTKMLFPLVFLILPAMMIILLGGVVLGLGDVLGGNL
jgi:tight adherence protein C